MADFTGKQIGVLQRLLEQKLSETTIEVPEDFPEHPVNGRRYTLAEAWLVVAAAHEAARLSAIFTAIEHAQQEANEKEAKANGKAPPKALLN